MAKASRRSTSSSSKKASGKSTASGPGPIRVRSSAPHFELRRCRQAAGEESGEARAEKIEGISMDFDFTPEQQRFRAEARAWLAENVPADLKGRAFAASRADRGEVDRLREWQRVLHKAGYVGIDWPAEYGGGGAPTLGQNILSEQASPPGAPP